MANRSHGWSPLPEDGAWHRSDWFREVASECGPPELVERAVEQLLPIFTPEWAKESPNGHQKIHPFAWLYRHRLGIAEIIALGRALEILGSPTELTRDLAHADRFASRAAEAWTAALFKGFGSRIEFIDETQVGKKCPEFIAHFPTGGVSVEHKGLNHGEDDERHTRLGLSYFMGAQEICTSEQNRDLPPSACEAFCSKGELESIALREDHDRGLEYAHERGRALALEVVDFLRINSMPGHYQIRPGLDLEVFNDSSNRSGLQLQTAFSSPSPKKIARRLTRSSLKHAAAKFQEWGLPGIIVVERRNQEHLDIEVMKILERDVARGQPWTKDVAAIFVCNKTYRHDNPTKSSIPRSIAFLSGPRSSELPLEIKVFGEPHQACGHAHFTFDILK